MQNGKCIIICAGQFDLDSIPVEPDDFVIAADGGYDYCRRLKIEPNLILGDFDSLDPEIKAELLQDVQNRIRILPAEKDDTDTLAAVREGLERGFREFVFYGSQGGRLSHTMANIQTLLFLKENGANGTLAEKYSRVFVIKGETVVLPENWKGYFSLFSLESQAEGVTIQNMKYELADAVLKNSFPIGVSNEFVGKPGRVSVKQGVLLAIAELQ